MPLRLSQFLELMDHHAERVPLDLLVRHLRDLSVSMEELRPFARFKPTGYTRNLIKAGNGYHALLLCWRAGQRSPIHDHRGSSCGVRVLHGEMTETIFESTAAGLVYPVSTGTLKTGEVCGSQDDDIHQVSNLMADSDLMTLHVYSPPLIHMGVYSLTSPGRSEVLDPVLECVGGDGI